MTSPDSTTDALLSALVERGAIVRRAKSGKLHTLDMRPIATGLSEDELDRLCRLGELRKLELEGAPVLDRHVELIAEHLPSLKHLDLQRTLITDASFPAIGRLPKLQFLLLTGAAVTREGVDALRKKLIGARIVFL